MLFNTPIFLVFFIVFFLLYVAVANALRWHLLLIVVASAVFYGAWDYRFVPLLFGTGLIDYYCALKIEDNRKAGRPNLRWLVLSITCNLGVLVIFKYSNFFLTSIASGASAVGLSFAVPHLDIILPAGISFYTFQSIAYTVDVYTRAAHARRDPMVFLSALSFFPHLVAGPIVRGANLMPQFERGPLITKERMQTGLLLIGAGLFKKTLADLVAPIVGECFAQAAQGPDLITAWTGALAFTAQVYGDFAGYSDIAIGLGLVLGYDFPLNFNLPYLANTPAEFWRRWHISLGTWLRDYLYAPLARNHGLFATVIITMGLSGLWHGAGMNFVLWGLYLGVLIFLSNVLQRALGNALKTRAAVIVGTVLTFHLVAVIGWTMFRAGSIQDGLRMIQSLHAGRWSVPSWELASDLGLVVLVLVVCHACDWLHLRYRKTMIRPAILIPFAILSFVVAFGLGRSHDFIYFAF